MDEGDEYVPQISQMEYMMDTGGPGPMTNGQQYNCSGGMSAMNYYEPNDSNALNAMQQMTNMYAPQQGGNCYMQNQQMMYQQPQMRPPVPQQQQPQQPPKNQQQQRYPPGYMGPPQMMQMRPPYDYAQQQQWNQYPPNMQNPQQSSQNYRPTSAVNGGPYGPQGGYPPNSQMPQNQNYYQQQARPPYYQQPGQQGIPQQGYPQQGGPPRYPNNQGQPQQQNQPQGAGYPGGYVDANGYYQQPSSSAGYSQGPQKAQTPQQSVPAPYGTPQGYPQGQQAPRPSAPGYGQMPPSGVMPGQQPQPGVMPGQQPQPGVMPGQQPQPGVMPGQQPFYHPQQIQMELMECDRQMQMLYQQQRTPEVMQRAEQLQQKMAYLKRLATQQMPPGYPAGPQMTSPGVSQQMQHYPPPPMSQDIKNPQSIPQNPQSIQQTPTSSVPGTPVSVMQTNANQVQVNITPEAPGRTLISVYHQNHQYPQPGSSGYPKEGLQQEPQTNHVPPPQQYSAYQNNNQIQKSGQIYPNPDGFEHKPKQVDKMLVGASELVTAEENYPEEHKIERIENVNAMRNQNQMDNGVTNDFNGMDYGQKEEEEKNESFEEKEMEGNNNGQETSNLSMDDFDFKPGAPAPEEVNDEDSSMSFKESAVTPVREENFEIKEEVKESEEVSETKDSEESTRTESSAISDSVPEAVPEPTIPISIEPASETSSLGNTPASFPNVRSEATSEATPIPEMDAEEDSVATEDVLGVSPEDQEVSKKKKNPTKPRSRKSVGQKKAPAGKSRKRKKDSDFEDEEDEDFSISTKRKQKRSTQQNSANASISGEGIMDSQELAFSDLVEKRRSGRRKVEDRSYIDEGLMDFEEPLDDLERPEDEEEEEDLKHFNMFEDVWIVEKIIAMRQEKRPIEKEESEENGEEEKMETEEEKNKEEINGVKEEEPSTTNGPESKSENPEEKNGEKKDEKNPEDDGMELVDVFFVKFRNKSYRHCAWKTIKELEVHDPKVTARCNRFRMKNEYLDEDAEDNELFNEDFLVADRVVDIEVDEDGQEYCLVKWHALQYEEATWERGETVNDDLKKYYHMWNDEIDPPKIKQPPRPGPEFFKPININTLYKGENQLREYQVEGVNWLLYCYFGRNNCILADEMGLGKTVQTITLLQGVYDAGIHGPFLVVVPLSTLHNWEREFETWTDLNAVVYHGGSKSREVIQQTEFYYKGTMEGKKKPVIKFDALITTFEMVVTDCEVLRKFNFRVCVIDEAHRLKNKNCKLLTGGLSNFKVDHRVLLTGTPLQNNINELFSLLNFLDPTKFDSQNEFLEKFGNCQSEEQVSALQSMLKPMMLRRLKEDVEKTLQPKQETIIEVQLSNIQKKYYRAILERNFTHLLKSTHMPSMMNTMMELRKCCNHPYLIKGAEDQIMTEIRDMYPEKSASEQVPTGLIQASGKLVLIDKLLPKLRQDGHKVLIFSQMVKVLDLLEEFLGFKNFSYERIDGNVRGDLRQAAIDRFSRPDSDKFVFLLCTRAGGLGINLTAADTVIIFDSDWNPQNDLQAQARCHRIGQTKMVKVYRLITANTYEREMFDRASLKLGLDKAVLQSMAPKEQNAQLTKKEVEDLLKKGAYGAVMDEDNEGSKFSEEDIETILQRRTQTITIEPGIKGSTFAKASFKSTNNEDIDVNDPNFWQKWANKAQIQIKEKGSELIVEEPRSRRRRFDEFNPDASGDDDVSDEDGKRSRDRSQGELRNRSGKKRRRPDDDDEEYYGTGGDELSFNKSDYFKLEKMILSWGWGRWDVIRDNLNGEMNVQEIEHMSRTLILHCLREFRGDERSREYVWKLITPKGEDVSKGDKRSSNMFSQGWASNPEYNPPGFAIDNSFKRHVYRHTNKLISRIHHLNLLKDEIITDKLTEKCQDPKVKHTDIDFSPPTVTDPPMPGWENGYDKNLLIGIYRHGTENYDLMREDENLIFHEKPTEEFPTPIELNNRFKRLIQTHMRQADIAVQNQLQLKVQIQNQIATRGHWTEQEETDFIKTLINFGVWDHSSGDKINIRWNKFREFSPSLSRKSDSQMIENLYCILARCSLIMGSALSEIDEARASQIRDLNKKTCTMIMQRLTLMRKVHIHFLTKDDETRRVHIKMMPLDKMPKGWTYAHDEKLFQVADSFGISSFKTKLSFLPEFKQTGFDMPSDQQLIQRLFEIVATVDSGKYSGDQDQMVFEMEDEQATEDEIMMLMMAAAIASQNPTLSSADVGRRSVAKKKTTPVPTTTKKENNKFSQGMDAAALQQYMTLVAAASVPQTGKAGSSDMANQLAQLALMQMAMSPAMNSNTAATAKALEDALNLSKKESTPKPGSSSSTKSTSNQANAMAMFSAATEAAFEQAAIQQLGITLPELMILQSMDPTFAQLLGLPSGSSASSNSNFNFSDPVGQLQALSILQMLTTSGTGATTPGSSKTDKKSNGSATPTSSKKSLGKIVEDLAKGSS
ncbi:hypothetical protein FO519_005661 [Halicephalobus sp. NKZ332]|nr:hypothetical protein FO519_005661 [Halicephalobus sp. NKZ332]